jgi:hypothetical protein
MVQDLNPRDAPIPLSWLDPLIYSKKQETVKATTLPLHIKSDSPIDIKATTPPLLKALQIRT